MPTTPERGRMKTSVSVTCVTIGSPWSPEIDPRRLENHPSGGPKFGQNGFQKVPWKPLGGPWTASGRPLGAKAGFRAILGSIEGPF